jgi:hypothetical protein
MIFFIEMTELKLTVISDYIVYSIIFLYKTLLYISPLVFQGGSIRLKGAMTGTTFLRVVKSPSNQKESLFKKNSNECFFLR